MSSEEENLDFDDGLAPEDLYVPDAAPRSNVYTVMLVVSAVFYVVALVATVTQLYPYCTNWMRF